MLFALVSCAAAGVCNNYKIIAGGGTFDAEISWTVTDDNGIQVVSGVSNFPGGVEVFLPDGCYTVNYIDSYGDGWNGAFFRVANEDNTLFVGTLSDGYEGSEQFCVEYVPPTPPCFEPGDIDFPSTVAGVDITIPECPTPCDNVTVAANVFEAGSTESYRVCSIDYNPPYPFDMGTPSVVGLDDVFSDIVTLPFDFCFYGNTFNQLVIGGNGLITFDETLANQNCHYYFNSQIPTPGTPGGFYNNSINAVFHDIDVTMGGNISHAVLGTAPFRAFVVNFNDVPHFACNTIRTTNQIVLYETINVIEVYIENKPTCPDWNSGNAVVGLQDATGTQGIAAPGRQTGPWSAANEAWRFTPDGAPIVSVEWFDQSGSLGTGTSLNIYPSEINEIIVARATYSWCDGSTVVVEDYSCELTSCNGCNDPQACNYIQFAVDTESCIYADGICETCSGEQDGTGVIIVNDSDGDGVCDSEEIVGCQNPWACNYNIFATDEGPCILPDGCTNPTACNYNPDAACDDNSCTFPGCTDPETVNYDPTAGCDDGSCIPTFGSFAINAPESMLYSDTLEIEVVVNNGQNIYGLFASLEYDTEHFEFIGSTLGNYLGSEVLASPPVDAAGSIEFGASKLGQQAGSNGDGLFYTLQFVPISSVLGAPIFVDFALSASNAFNADGISGELFLPETQSVELIFEAEVWPGDLNHDGIVNVADILPIGYFYDISGPERPNASLAWQGQNCPIWRTGASFPGDGFYQVFADGNGDGVVNLADQVAVGFNIDQTVSLNIAPSNLEMLAFAQNSNVLVPISNEVTPSQINIPGTASITVQFFATTNAVDVETLFGFTMNIDLSPLGILASDAEIDFSSSEFGVLNETLIAQTYAQGNQLDLAITRTTPNNIVGEILLFEMTLPIDSNLSAGSYTLPVNIGSANDPTGQIALLNAQNIQISVSSSLGCIDANACNFNPDATIDDGSCIIIGATCDDNNGETINDVINSDCVCEGELIVEIVLGCTDLNACNYDINANQDDGSCFSIGELCDDNDPTTENDIIQDNCLCEGEKALVIFGCTDPEACNFNEEANVDDESCTYVVTYEITGTNIPQAFSTQNYSYTNTSGSTYQWSITGGVIVSGQGSASIEVVWSSQGGGSIIVVETNEDGCVGAGVNFEVVILPTNIFEQTQQSINIFPNPASTSVTITIDESLINSNYQLFDAQGKLVSEGVLTKTNTTLNATGFAAGNYVISISNNLDVMRQQLIIEK